MVVTLKVGEQTLLMQSTSPRSIAARSISSSVAEPINDAPPFNTTNARFACVTTRAHVRIAVKQWRPVLKARQTLPRYRRVLPLRSGECFASREVLEVCVAFRPYSSEDYLGCILPVSSRLARWVPLQGRHLVPTGWRARCSKPESAAAPEGFAPCISHVRVARTLGDL